MSFYAYNIVSESTLAKAENFHQAFSNLLPSLSIENIESIETDEIMREAFPEYIRGLFRFPEAKYLYLFQASHEENQIKYIFAIGADEQEDRKVFEERSRGTKVDIGERSYIDQALDGKLAGPEREANEFGEVWAYYFPLRDKEGTIVAIIGLDFDVTMIHQKTTHYVVRTVLIANIVLITVLGLLLLILRRKVFTPIKRLSVQMNNFDPEKKHEILKLRTYHEIEEINNAFDQMSEDIIGYINHLRAMTEEHSCAAAELNIARSIQIGMVPQQLSLSGEGYDICAYATLAKEVGGDFYDCFERNGKVCIVIADVSGKGIAAALFMAMTKNMIRGKLQAGASPAEALNDVNNEICAENPENMFVTVFAAILDPSTGELRYANAGHTRPLIIYGETKDYLNPEPGIVLGLFENAGISDEYVMLGSGSSILIYTDGVTEALNMHRELFGEQRLLEAATAGNAEQTAASVIDAVKMHSANREQSDDITLIAARFTPCEAFVDEPLAPEMKALGVMQNRLNAIAGNNMITRKIALACEEILVNIISYSGANEIRMTMGIRTNQLTVRFEDNGKEFDPFKEVPAEKEFSDYDRGGLGIRMVMQIAEQTSYSRISGRNIVSMTFSIRNPEQEIK